MDAADKAKELEQMQRKKGIEIATAALKQQGTLNCVDCDVEIPPARRQAYPAATRCISCQELIERGKR